MIEFPTKYSLGEKIKILIKTRIEQKNIERQFVEREIQKVHITNNQRNASQNEMPLFAHNISKKFR